MEIHQHGNPADFGVRWASRQYGRLVQIDWLEIDRFGKTEVLENLLLEWLIELQSRPLTVTN